LGGSQNNYFRDDFSLYSFILYYTGFILYYTGLFDTIQVYFVLYMFI